MNIWNSFLSPIFGYHPKEQYDFSLQETNKFIDSSCTLDVEKKELYSSLAVNLDYLKVKYNTLINSDINVRPFTLTARNKQYNAFILYIDGMIDTKTVNDFVLEPLMLRNQANTFSAEENQVSTAIANNISVRKVKKFNLEDYIYNCLIPQNAISKKKEFAEIISDVNSGNCALFVDTLSIAFSIEVKGFKSRSISAPNNEMVVRGSQEAFVETIRTNTSLLRRIINNENLIIENSTVRQNNQNQNCNLLYEKHSK